MSEDLRDRLVAAARELLEDPEAESLDLREVARRAGKSRTAPYVAWGPKEQGGGIEALRIAVAASGFRDLADRLRAAPRREPTGKALAQVGEEYFGFAEDNPGLFRIMFGPEVARGLERLTDGETVHPEVERMLESRRDAQDAIQAALEKDLDRGAELGVGTRKAALSAWAMFHGAAVLLIDGQFAVENLTPEAAKDLVVSYLLSEPVDGVVEAAADLTRAKIAKEAARSSPDILLAMEATESRSIRPTAREDLGPSRTYARPEGETRDRLSEGARSGYLLNRDNSRARFGESTTLRRLQRNAGTLDDASILWIDDHPEWSAHEENMLKRLGAKVVRAPDTDEALETGGQRSFDLILSDIARPRSYRAGIEDLPKVRKAFPGVPVVFYVGRVDPGTSNPAGSFGITNDPEELLHLILDILERRRS